MFKCSDQCISTAFPQRRRWICPISRGRCLSKSTFPLARLWPAVGLSSFPAAGALSSFMPKPRLHQALPKGQFLLCPALPTGELPFESVLHLCHKGSQPSEPVTCSLFYSPITTDLKVSTTELTQVEKKEGKCLAAG